MKHITEASETCSICGRRYSLAYQFDAHMEGHSAPSPLPAEEVAELICVHCGMQLTKPIGGGLYSHANNLQRCQSDVPYGHMGHPLMPCPSGTVNDCLGSREDRCNHFTVALSAAQSPTPSDEELKAARIATRKQVQAILDDPLSKHFDSATLSAQIVMAVAALTTTEGQNS